MTETASALDQGVGRSARRPDAVLKVTGEFAYASDLWLEAESGRVLLTPPARS